MYNLVVKSTEGRVQDDNRSSTVQTPGINGELKNHQGSCLKGLTICQYDGVFSRLVKFRIDLHFLFNVTMIFMMTSKMKLIYPHI